MFHINEDEVIAYASEQASEECLSNMILIEMAWRVLISAFGIFGLNTIIGE